MNAVGSIIARGQYKILRFLDTFSQQRFPVSVRKKKLKTSCVDDVISTISTRCANHAPCRSHNREPTRFDEIVTGTAVKVTESVKSAI